MNHYQTQYYKMITADVITKLNFLPVAPEFSCLEITYNSSAMDDSTQAYPSFTDPG